MACIKKIKETVKRLAVKNNAEFAFIFGSFARGSQTKDSDLDVIFIEDTVKPYLSRLDKYFLPLSELMGSSVDVFVYTPEEFKKIKKRPFFKNILKEGVVVFESGKI